MKRAFLSLLMSLLITGAYARTLTYTIDHRKYFDSAETRSSWPYNTVVAVDTKIGRCTGTLLSQNYMMTAGHCIAGVDAKDKCSGRVGDTLTFKIFSYGNPVSARGSVIACEHSESGGADYGDWAIVKINDVEPAARDALYRISQYPKIEKFPPVGKTVVNIGYGALRVVADEELAEAKEIFINYLKQVRQSKEMGDDNIALAKKRLEVYGDSYDVLDDGMSKDAIEIINYIYSVKGRAPLTPDSNNAKIDNSCMITKETVWSNTFASESNCQAWGGNSGGPVFAEIGAGDYSIVGIMIRSSALLSKIGGSVTNLTHPKEYYNELKRTCADCRF